MIKQDADVDDRSAAIAIFTDETRAASLADWAVDQGVDPAATLLAGGLARSAKEGQATFVEAFVAQRCNSSGSALRWLLWLWSDAAPSMRARLTDDGDLRAAEAVMEMHRRALSGDRVDAAEWRIARRRFAIGVTPGASTATVEAITSSMWDVRTAPGAIADAARSWIVRSADHDALAPADWTEAEHARVTATWDEYGIEHARHNRQHPDETDAAFNERMGAYMADHPLALTPEDWSRWNAWKDHHQRLTKQRTEELRAGLLAIIAP